MKESGVAVLLWGGATLLIGAALTFTATDDLSMWGGGFLIGIGTIALLVVLAHHYDSK